MNFVEEINPLSAVACLAVTLWLVKVTKIESLMPTKSDRLTQIDGLRAILALSVFFHHFAIFYQWRHIGEWTGLKSQFYSVLGSFGVIGFFMITGFLFFGKIKAVRGNLDLNKFYIGRVFRLYPVWLFSVLCIYIEGLWASHFQVREYLVPNLDKWLFFIGAGVNQVLDTPMLNASVQWSLIYEWIFYLSIPAVAFVWKRLGLGTWVVFYLTVLTLWLRATPFHIPNNDFDLTLFAPFALGGLASELARLEFVRRHAKTLKVTGAMLVILALFLVSFMSAYSLAAYLLLAAFFLPICAGNDIFGFLKWKPLVFLGEISYDIYLFHGITLYTLYRLIFRHLMEKTTTDWQVFLCMLSSMICVVIVSSLVHYFVERPALKMVGKLYNIDRTQELAAP
jgi:peptidoglycan/LPS O-acetylase OafA/YrhL